MRKATWLLAILPLIAGYAPAQELAIEDEQEIQEQLRQLEQERRNQERDLERELKSHERELKDREKDLKKLDRQFQAMAMPSFPGASSYLGVGVAEVDDQRAKELKLKEERGVEIRKVEEGSPAGKAGLKEHDVVLEYNGQPVEGIESFIRMVRETPVGRTAKMLISRDGATQTITARVGQRKDAGHTFTFTVPPIPPIPPMPPIDVPRPLMATRTTRIGVETESLSGQLSEFFGVKDGVLVRAVDKDSPAEKAGLKAGDVIVKVDDEKVSRPNEVSEALRSAWEKKSIPVLVVRNKKEVTLNLELPERSGGERRPRSVIQREKL